MPVQKTECACRKAGLQEGSDLTYSNGARRTTEQSKEALVVKKKNTTRESPLLLVRILGLDETEEAQRIQIAVYNLRYKGERATEISSNTY